MVGGPARELAEALRAAGTDDAAAQQLLESYLRLACEGIGLGYFFPPELGEGFFTHAFFRLIPRGSPCCPARSGRRRSPTPGTWARTWSTRLPGGGACSCGCRTEPRSERCRRSSCGRRGTRSESRARGSGRTLHLLIDLGAEERQFLPGALHFVAPTVACVHDRHEAASSRTLGVWLVDPPLVLGPMGCDARVGPSSDRLDLVDDVVKQDPRASDVLNAAANDWRAALTLETSQFLVGIYPA